MAKKNLLSDYHKKRDFKITKEPSGKKKVAKKSSKLTFVVQEHHASHLHYDFRLELDGVLKSWAVPKGPSMDPADKRLAMQTEDHPLEYGKFHGTIPQGEYGGGEVFIWDNGTWECESPDPHAALEKGDLKFTLKGKKLKGSFVLVKTRYGGSKNSWLLIKHKDEFAAGLGKGAVKPIKKVAAKKAKKKVSKKKALKSTKGSDPFPGFIKPALSRLVTTPPEGSDTWIHEMKFDGYRMQTHLKNGLARMYTRNGLDWSNTFPHLLSNIEEVDAMSAIFDGEVVALDEKGRTNFQMLQNSLTKKNDKHLRYYIFDILYLDGKDLRSLPLMERKEILKKVLKKSPSNILFSEHFETSGKDFFKASCDHELEGIVSKLANSPYISGRHDAWVKTKCTSRQEFVIGGWSEPQGGRIGIGALLLGIYENGMLKYAGRVGTGFSHQTLQDLKMKLKPLEIKDSPFEINSPRGKDTHWLKPEKVCEVSFSNWTDEGILRTPVFLGMREDKPAQEIHMEKAKKKKTSKKETVRKISSPDKILFKNEKITKEKVANFYQAISKYMLPYLADRPLSLVRCPNGSEEQCFFQKHISGNMPEAFHPFPVKEEKGEGIYLSIDSPAGLMELVQLNAFEIHAWNSHKDNYMAPDQIVMDFDPGPGVPWKKVVDACFELKEILEDLNLKSFVKMTGGKGLHVHIPIAPLYTWDQIKSFAQTLALEMVNRKPDMYVANMSKKLRTKKIFVDYLRNGYGATAVVPYSLRAKALSAIALPVEWTELRRIKGPQEFTIDKALKKIKSRKRDPWAGMLKLKQKIEILEPKGKGKKAA